MYIYRPQSQPIPGSVPRHGFHGKWKRAKPLIPFIVYDVFRSADGCKLIAVCPPLHRLRKILFPLKIFVQGEQLEYRMSIYPLQNISEANYFMEGDIPQHLQKQSHLNVTFLWKSHTHECKVSANPFAQVVKPKNMTLVTLQKNNPAQWIQDWCLYYHRVHQIDHIVLYDNGSKNLDDVSEALSHLSPTLSIQIMHWDFPYRLGQIGALNHVYQMLGCRSHYYLNFDVDEYLIHSGEHSLLQVIEALTNKEHFLNLEVPGYWTPGLLQNMSAEKRLLRITDFSKYTWKRSKRCPPKTIFSCAGIAHVHVHHNATMEDQNAMLMLLKKPYRNIIAYVLLHLKRLVYWTESPVQEWVLIKRWVLCLNKYRRQFLTMRRKASLQERTRQQQMLSQDLQTERQSASNLYFNHYTALTTGWNTPQRLEIKAITAKRLKEDIAMKAMLERAKLKP